MGKRFEFDVQKAIATAWDALWANNLKQRAAEKTGRWANRTYYICAVDIENQVRAWAQDTADGKPWDMKRLAYGRPMVQVRFRGDLQRTVRDWLFRNPKITYHNFGRGHISGARFRPVGEPIAPSETETLARKTKQRAEGYKRPEHFARSYGARPLCQQERLQGRHSFRQSRAWSTTDWAKVTCKQCLNLKASYKPPAERKAS